MAAQGSLQKELEADGWTIKALKIDQGCYEVYGYDAAVKKTETYFNPKTFEVIGQQ